MLDMEGHDMEERKAGRFQLLMHKTVVKGWKGNGEILKSVPKLQPVVGPAFPKLISWVQSNRATLGLGRLHGVWKPLFLHMAIANMALAMVLWQGKKNRGRYICLYMTSSIRSVPASQNTWALM
jgi:hypothetical protein